MFSRRDLEEHIGSGVDEERYSACVCSAPSLRDSLDLIFNRSQSAFGWTVLQIAPDGAGVDCRSHCSGNAFCVHSVPALEVDTHGNLNGRDDT